MSGFPAQMFALPHCTLLISLFLPRIECYNQDNSIQLVMDPGIEGAPCSLAENWRAVPGRPTQFFYCDAGLGTWRRERCARIVGGLMRFDQRQKRCVQYRNPGLLFASTGSTKVGEYCQYNTDCVDGGYCNQQFCACLSSYIAYQQFCYPKVNPGQGSCYSGVIGDLQCSSVWPSTKCLSSVCKCCDPVNFLTDNVCSKEIASTQDGPVCVDTPGACPLGGTSAFLAATATPTTAISCTIGTTTDCLGLLYQYDCIPNSATTSTTDGVCCPSKALACTLPKLGETAGAGGVTRWFWDALLGSCVNFQWNSVTPTVSTQNANNFATQQHCESYCGSGCPRGSAESAGTPAARRSCAAGATGCSTNFECHSFGSNAFCCPTTAFVCGVSGGISGLATAPASDGVDCSTAALMKSPNLRYRFDATSSRCLPFTTYKGCGGTWNNFLNSQECENFCRGLSCAVGAPLKDANGNFKSCSGASQCPSTHSCTNNFCCPNKQSVCSAPRQFGSCVTYQTRFWFNAATQLCEEFTYSGCQGNDNNFPDPLACQSFCRGVKPAPQCAQGSAAKDFAGNYVACNAGGLATGCPSSYECYFDGALYGCCPVKCEARAEVGTRPGITERGKGVEI